MRIDTERAEYSAKAFANLQARAALAGFAVNAIKDDRGQQAFIVSKWNLTRQCSTLAELTTFLLMVGVRL